MCCQASLCRGGGSWPSWIRKRHVGGGNNEEQRWYCWRIQVENVHIVAFRNRPASERLTFHCNITWQIQSKPTQAPADSTFPTVPGRPSIMSTRNPIVRNESRNRGDVRSQHSGGAGSKTRRKESPRELDGSNSESNSDEAKSDEFKSDESQRICVKFRSELYQERVEKANET